MLPIEYSGLVEQLRQEIYTARLRVSLTANQQLLTLYWKIGKAILSQQESAGWGAKVIDQLSADLRHEFPDMKGLSVRNLKYMRAFAEAYPQFVQGPPAQTHDHTFQAQNDRPIVQALLAQLPWYHHITLLDKVKEERQRFFYIEQAVNNNWSRNVLVHQVESNLYRRQGSAVSNFNTALPVPQSDLARELLKDPYKFDFLNLYDEYKERDLEKALTDNITRFLMELGAGFSYVGRQYQLTIGDQDFYIDLLFYHLRLRCFVVLELKTGKFIPEYAGKLNFYLNAVDDQLKHKDDHPSIGILICKERDRVVAEYALRGIEKPMGITEYELTQAIPADLQGSLPSIEEIEEKLRKS